MLLLSLVFSSPGEPCAMIFQGRLWHMTEVCELQEKLDLKANKLGIPEDYDQTFVYVSRISGDAEGHFSVMQIGPGASLENAYIYIDAVINMSEVPHTEEVYFGVFDSVQGGIKNVTVVGTVNFIEFRADKYIQAFFSTFFGQVSTVGFDRTISDNSINFRNLSTNLEIQINGSKISTNTTISGCTVKVLTSLDQMMPLNRKYGDIDYTIAVSST